MRAYVFPGVGRQKKGMGGDLFRRFPDLSRRADEVLGWSVEQLCRDNPGRRLTQTRYSQPVTYVVNALHHRAAVARAEPAANFTAGHSLGEYNALLAAGAFEFETGLRLVARRAELMSESPPGGMAAVVGTSEESVMAILASPEGEGLVVANHNAPDQFVLAGSVDALKRVRPAVERRHGEDSFVPLTVGTVASHSPLMRDAAAAFREILSTAELRTPHIPVVSNVTGRPVAAGAPALRDELAEHMVRPVRWTDTVRYLRRVGVREFVELGENDTLTKLIARTPGSGSDSDPGETSSSTWREYRDERILALLERHLAGATDLEDVVAAIDAGPPGGGTGGR